MSSTTHPKTDLPQAQKSSDRGPPASPDPESRAIAYPPPHASSGSPEPPP